MALITRFINTASTSGGDGTTNNTTGATRAYASLNEAETAEATDLVSAGDSIEFVCTGSAADTTTTTFSTGWVTSATNTVTVRPNATDLNTTGIYDTSKYRIETSAGYVINIRMISPCNHAEIKNIQSKVGGSQAICISVKGGSGNYLVFGCFVFDGAGSATRGIEFGAVGTDFAIVNNVAYDFPSRGISNTTYSGSGSRTIYNNTVDGCGVGLRWQSGSATPRAFNNLLTNNTTDYASIGGVTTDNNVTSDGTGPDAGHINKTITYVNAAGKDFQTSDADIVGLGTDLSADATFPFSTDILGVARGGSWDIGAFQSGGGGGVTVTATEILNSFADSSVIDIDFNVSLSVTEVLSPFTDTSTLSITSGNVVLANITETLNAFSDSSTINVSANISATVTEVLNSFLDGSNVTIAKDITVEVTEVLASFVDSSALRFPTNWVDKPAVITSYTTQTPVTTIWTDKG